MHKIRNSKRMMGLTLTEIVMAMAIIAVVFAAIIPLFTNIRNSWASRDSSSEALQAGRILVESLKLNLSQAAKIIDVSGSNDTMGFIEYEDNSGVIYRYEVGEDDYVYFGVPGDVSPIAGPVTEIQFSCYSLDDFTFPTTDTNAIRYVEVNFTVENAATLGQDKSFLISAYVQTNKTADSDGNILLIVQDPDSLSTYENNLKNMIESFGFDVAMMDEEESSFTFAMAFGNYDAVYIPTHVYSANVSGKFNNAPIGVVTEEQSQYDDLGLSTDGRTITGDSIVILDNTHYITSVFNTGELRITNVETDLLKTLNGIYAPDLASLAKEVGGQAKITLGALDTSQTTCYSGKAAGRRVSLPWGKDPFDVTILTQNGRTIMQRALEWAANSSPAVVFYGEYGNNKPFYRVGNKNRWSASDNTGNVGGYSYWVVAEKCPTRNEVAICTLDHRCDINLQFYDGDSFTTPVELTNDTIVCIQRAFHSAYEHNSGDLLIAYRHYNNPELYYRTYNGSTLSGSSTADFPGTGYPKWIRLAANPSSDEIIAVVLDSDEDVSAMVWDGSSWGDEILLENNSQTSDHESIWAAYEGVSGRAMVVCNGASWGQWHYCIWDGSSWSSVEDGPAWSDDPRWVKLAASKTTNEMIYGSVDIGNDVQIAVWDGSSWGSPFVTEWNSPYDYRRAFDIAYRGNGDKALVIYSSSGWDNLFYRIYNGSGWSFEYTGPALNSEAKIIQLIPNETGDSVFITAYNSDGEIESLFWNGTAVSNVVTTFDDGGGSMMEGFMVVPGFTSLIDSDAAILP